MSQDASASAVPFELGYRMPAEWEPHRATWIAWPHQRDDWPDKFDPIPWTYGEIVRHLHHGEEVCILVNDADGQRQAETVLDKLDLDRGRIRFWQIPTDRVWTRDYGPLFLVGGNGVAPVGALVNFAFNGWAKYDNWQRDNEMTEQINDKLRRKIWQPVVNDRRVVLEGGSIEVSGTGLLLTTEECLLSNVQERNPGFTRADYERLFADYLGVRKVLWLSRGIAGDDTHGHIDDLARFVGPHAVVTVVEEDRGDVNYDPLQENLQRLRGMTDETGQPLEIHTLPMPAPLYFAGQRLPASYANFYIANDRVLMPTFNDPNDRRALNILADLFPDRVIVGIHAVDLVWGLGTLHCLTQQEPAGG
ncbi:MAG TPA: agmatine deiminase family protein [Gemmataceae bacterium]|nr:agmatine deiminase family protein [Gemmataceae bacterium]